MYTIQKRYYKLKVYITKYILFLVIVLMWIIKNTEQGITKSEKRSLRCQCLKINDTIQSNMSQMCIRQGCLNVLQKTTFLAQRDTDN